MVTLTPATAADWERAWAIQRAAFDGLVTRMGGGWTDEAVRRCAAAWAPENTRLVEVDGALAGWIRLERHHDHDWLDLIVIDPRHQARGLGAALMRGLMAEAGARGVPLWLSVYRENEARRLYARLGFAELPRDEIRVFMVFPGDRPLMAPR